jgi:hypothetical protein
MLAMDREGRGVDTPAYHSGCTQSCRHLSPIQSKIEPGWLSTPPIRKGRGVATGTLFVLDVRI